MKYIRYLLLVAAFWIILSNQAVKGYTMSGESNVVGFPNGNVTAQATFTGSPIAGGDIVITADSLQGQYDGNPTGIQLSWEWMGFSGLMSQGHTRQFPPGSTVTFRMIFQGIHPIGDALIVQLGGVAPGDERTFLLSYLNSQEYSVTLRVLDASDPNNEIGTVTLAPGQGILQQFDVPDEVTDLIVVTEAVDLLFSDGAWVEVPGAVTEVAENGPYPSEVIPEGTQAQDEVAVPEPGNAPVTNNNFNEGDNIIWSQDNDTTTVTILDKSTFREGVDKLIDAVGSGGGSVNVDVDTGEIVDAIEAQTAELLDDSQAPSDPAAIDPIEPEEVIAMEGDLTNALGMLPDAPSIVSPGTVSTLALNMNLGEAGTYSTTIDFSQYSGPITVFRNLLKAVLTIWFFFLIVKTIREAFAN